MTGATHSITTHVLDTSTGRPAANVPFELARQTTEAAGWEPLTQGTTNSDGRATVLTGESLPVVGIYRLTFATGAYFEGRGVATFYPKVSIEFRIEAALEHHHVPLLVSPFGYSTYRGS